MTDIRWEDAYDDAEGLAEEVERAEHLLYQRGLYTAAIDVRWGVRVLREQAERIAELEARPTPAPRLPWVDIVECLPELGPGRVLVIPRYGSDDNLGEPTTAPISLLHEQPDLYAYWCELSAIALPGQPAPEQGVTPNEDPEIDGIYWSEWHVTPVMLCKGRWYTQDETSCWPNFGAREEYLERQRLHDKPQGTLVGPLPGFEFEENES